MRILLRATTLALATGTALGSFPLHVGFGVMARQNENLQSFTGALGNVPAPPITTSTDPKRPFEVDGNTFNDLASAVQRSCDDQNTDCSQAANNGHNSGGLTVAACTAQHDACLKAPPVSSSASASASATTSSSVEIVTPTFTGLPQSSDAEFFYFCDP